jgi:leucyl aminopeptidase
MKLIKAGRKPTKGHLILFCTEIQQVDPAYFSPEEVQYMHLQYKKHKVRKFSFNRLEHWVYVRFCDKVSNLWLSLEACRKAGDSLLSTISKHKVKAATLIDLSGENSHVLAFTEGMLLGSYQFLKYRKDAAEKEVPLKELKIYCSGIHSAELQELQLLAESVITARELVNEPISELSAEKLASIFESMALECGVKAEVLNKNRLEALKMGGILAVNRGSLDPPTFTILEWNPEKAINSKPIVLVGKGIVYDTGGLSLKPAKSMETMKCDMAGSAMMAAAICAIARARLPLHVIALLPATDNRPGGNAYAPGDIIRMHDGSTVEVLNTDAEGRLILADALAYARKLNPQLVINAATLTGSAANAIGHFGIVAMQVDADRPFQKLKLAGDKVHERLVEFPMWEDYGELIKSDVADLKNIGGSFAGMITAGKFLQHFTSYPFIHLDIAGPAFVEKRDSYRGLGGTGTGVRLLFRFAKDLVENKR